MPVERGQTLSHYRLVEKIGEGGMGVVWKAEDTLLGRAVAIKVLPPDAARDDTRRRLFLQEARLASSVSHAHIAQVHDLGREEGLDFIVMEYVGGKPLNRILHGRPLPPDKVAGLGVQVAQALARAHRKGLLHRDLKPGNILVTPDGDVKVVDFGLATLMGPADTTRVSEMSTAVPGAGGPDSAVAPDSVTWKPLAGTLPYMSPEQARGETLDTRSDIFSLGTVLYEMTTGQRPFTGATTAALLEEVVKARPKPPHDLVPKLPLELDRIIQKGLAPSRADRYQTMEDLAVDLKRLARDLETGSSPSYGDLKGVTAPSGRKRLWILAASTAFLMIAAAAVLTLVGRWPGAAAEARTILVLPMEVRGQADGAAYAGRAFAEAIAVNLVQSKQLKVLPVPAEAPREGSHPRGLARAAREAGAGAFLTGSLTREERAVHVSLNLVDVADNHILWGVQKDAAGSPLTTLAAGLAREMAAALGATSPTLYDYFMNPTGDAAMLRSPDMTEALGALRRWEGRPALEATGRLVEVFPNESSARALRTWALLQDLWLRHVVPNPATVKPIDESVAELRRLDPRSPWCEFFRAWSMNDLERGREILEIYTQILERDDLTPAARAFILSFRGDQHHSLGENDAGAADMEEALRLDPANDQLYGIHGGDLESAGRHEEALTFARQALALNPVDPYNHGTISSALRGLGRWEEAVAPAAKACELGRGQAYCGGYAVALQRAGHATEALEEAKKAAALPDTFPGSRALACYWTLAGNRPEALRRLRRAVQIGTVEFVIKGDSCFEPLHGDPEYEAIVAEARRLYPYAVRRFD